jgi:hypothetical protein
MAAAVIISMEHSSHVVGKVERILRVSSVVPAEDGGNNDDQVKMMLMRRR